MIFSKYFWASCYFIFLGIYFKILTQNNVHILCPQNYSQTLARMVITQFEFVYLSERFLSQFYSTLIPFLNKYHCCILYSSTIEIKILTELLTDLHVLASSSLNTDKLSPWEHTQNLNLYSTDNWNLQFFLQWTASFMMFQHAV